LPEQHGISEDSNVPMIDLMFGWRRGEIRQRSTDQIKRSFASEMMIVLHR
jgi:hypothetical protein